MPPEQKVAFDVEITMGDPARSAVSSVIPQFLTAAAGTGIAVVVSGLTFANALTHDFAYNVTDGWLMATTGIATVAAIIGTLGWSAAKDTIKNLSQKFDAIGGAGQARPLVRKVMSQARFTTLLGGTVGLHQAGFITEMARNTPTTVWDVAAGQGVSALFLAVAALYINDAKRPLAALEQLPFAIQSAMDQALRTLVETNRPQAQPEQAVKPKRPVDPKLH